MANTYTQIYIHFVFAVENRQSLLSSEVRQQLYKYITAIIQANNHKVLAINGNENHIHIFIGMNEEQSISELLKIVKSSSSKWINLNKLTKGVFNWQKGYGAFSYSASHISAVCQ